MKLSQLSIIFLTSLAIYFLFPNSTFLQVMIAISVALVLEKVFSGGSCE